MKKIVPFIISLFISCPFLFAQNLVPNGSFESLKNLPVKRNPKNVFPYEPQSGYKPFLINLRFWLAGNNATPDLRITNREALNDCKLRFSYCDEAHTGLHSVGIMTHLSNKLTDTYREYIQVRLKEPLRPNVPTYVEYWVRKTGRAKLVTNNLGCHFSMEKLFQRGFENLPVEPQINYSEILNKEGQKWEKIEGSFIPDKPYEFFLLGNFFRNDQTTITRFQYYNGPGYVPPYAYYLIDDIKVWQESDSTLLLFDQQEIKPETAIELKNIEFEFDRSVIQPESIPALTKLLGFLNEYPTVKIQVQGHTDHDGDNTYNLQLSAARAEAITKYLADNGIDSSRLSYIGLGEDQPIKTNQTELGRARNRRVEFIILDPN